MILVLPATTVEYIRNDVNASVDLTGFPVEVAIMAEGTSPTAPDWEAAGWDGDHIRYLYDGTASAGQYDYWVRITAAPEVPVRNTGIVIFT